jgi:hypothetical protein
MIVVGLIPAVALFVISLASALISLRWASIGYAAAIYFLLIIIVLSCLCVRAPNDPGRRVILTDAEERLFKKHYAFFRFPMGTQNYVHFLNFARMFGIVWILICFWQGLYWTAGSLAVFYAISSPVMVWLMPIAHYKEGAEKGHEFARRNLAMIDHILQNRDFLKF